LFCILPFCLQTYICEEFENKARSYCVISLEFFCTKIPLKEAQLGLRNIEVTVKKNVINDFHDRLSLLVICLRCVLVAASVPFFKFI